MTVEASKLGPGTLKLGPTATTLDVSCQVQACAIEPAWDEGDVLDTLCGETVPGAVTTTYALTGTFIQDIGAADGILAYSWANNATAVEFEFVPVTSLVTKVTGTVQVRALTIGGETGSTLTADFDWPCQGTPVPTFGGP